MKFTIECSEAQLTAWRTAADGRSVEEWATRALDVAALRSSSELAKATNADHARRLAAFDDAHR